LSTLNIQQDPEPIAKRGEKMLLTKLQLIVREAL